MVTSSDKHPRHIPAAERSLSAAKRFLARAFSEAGLPFAEEDAREIILSAIGMDRSALIIRGAEPLETDAIDIIHEHMRRRLAGEPVDHILGWREFYGRRFRISSDVLSPRADTENLISGGLLRLENITNPQILDLGAGSGAIGLTLLAERPDAQLIATDVSHAALDIARLNAEALDLQNRARLSQGSWWTAVPNAARFDMILSNPPYITNEAMENLETEVKHYDPDLALRGGEDGLTAYRDILMQAGTYLKPQAWLGFEIGFDQGAALQDLLRRGPWTEISVDQDLGGLDRVVWAQKSD